MACGGRVVILRDVVSNAAIMPYGSSQAQEMNQLVTERYVTGIPGNADTSWHAMGPA